MGGEKEKSFNYYKDKEGYRNYYDSLILASGQTVRIEFNEYNSWHKYYYSIYLVAYHKRKAIDSTYLKVTGKDGLRVLLWAKDRIKEFEKFIIQERKGPIIVYCHWDDNRRRNVYERGLKNVGYTFGKVFRTKALLKELKGV